MGSSAAIAFVVACGCLLGGAANAHAQERSAATAEAPLAAPHELPYLRFVGAAMGGTGLRFNNPYRLATPLGDDAKSLSRTAAYVDLGAGVLVGDPRLVQHGPALRVSFAVEGIAQQILAPSYVVCRQWSALQPCARAAVPIVLAPDSNVGVELGLGGTYWVRSGIGVTAEGVFDLFYGASTRDVAYPAYPVLSLSLGVAISYEVLP